MKGSEKTYDALIFDLGGVILNIEPERIKTGLSPEQAKRLEGSLPYFRETALFEKLETGDVSPDEFRTAIRKALNNNLSDEKVDEIWNRLLLDYPNENIEILKALKKKHRLFLLSNTNIIHFECYAPLLVQKHGLAFSDIFEKLYLSHEIAMRKPDEKIFQYVLDDAGLLPHNTLFIDDLEENVKAAERVGISGMHVERNKGLQHYFSI